MKKISYILIFLAGIVITSCNKEERVANFKDVQQYTIRDYLLENEDQFSSFISILEAGGLDITLGAYNPNGVGYTLFLPNNDAINNFINKDPQISSLDDITGNSDYAAEFCRYHVVNGSYKTNDFPFGAFPEPTLTNDYLTVSFIIENDTSYYKINNQAAVIKPNIEVSNGYIHVIGTALQPVNFNTYQWLESNPGYTIFKKAVDLTGLKPELSINIKEDNSAQPVTLLLESDEIYNNFGIFSLNDLIDTISPGNDDYTSSTNPLYKLVAYHMVKGYYFMDDFEGKKENYNTFSEVPLNINGDRIDFAINQGKEIFDTIVVQGDTTFVDYIGFLYDDSNILTQSGVIHMINKLMKQVRPSRSTQTFQFQEETAFNQYKGKAGTYLIEKEPPLNFIQWDGADLYFVDFGNQETTAWGGDYLEMNGDFTISYQIPSVVQGNYEMYLRAELFNSQNALVEVFLDGKKVGGNVDLSKGGTADKPFNNVLIGTIDFTSFNTHKIEIRSLIPGRFLWDGIRFEPI